MPNAKYNRGAYYERKTMLSLEEVGMNAYRAAGSHGVFDVIAYDDHICRLVQVKSTQKSVRHSLYRQDLLKIFLSKTPENFTRELWIYGLVDGKKKGVVKVCVL